MHPSPILEVRVVLFVASAWRARGGWDLVWVQRESGAVATVHP